MPGTAARFGVTSVHDPVQNLGAGARYLRILLDLFKGNVTLALAGYNSGEGNVIKYGHRVPPFRETQEYVVKVGSVLNRQRPRYAAPLVLTAQVRGGGLLHAAPTTAAPTDSPATEPTTKAEPKTKAEPAAEEEYVETKSVYYWNRKKN